jgi:hypothetical protein
MGTPRRILTVGPRDVDGRWLTSLTIDDGAAIELEMLPAVDSWAQVEQLAKLHRADHVSARPEVLQEMTADAAGATLPQQDRQPG